MSRYVTSALIAFAITIACLLPPVLHFITGPLGPFIGGLVSGLRAKAQFRHALLIGFLLGISMAVFFLVVVNIISSLQISVPEMMQKLVASENFMDISLFKIALIPLSYGAALGTLGAWLGGKIAGKSIKD